MPGAGRPSVGDPGTTGAHNRAVKLQTDTARCGIVFKTRSQAALSPAKQPVRRRHVPQRTCVACRRVDSKRELVRVVRTANEGVQVDPTGKRAGRGAYVCRSKACWDRALRTSALARALKTTLTTDDLARLAAFAATLPDETALERSSAS
ncbi:MAG: YlxR family protein [Anaerolineae bacterium]|nr:YlxR family protein [Anaerolineae bacterium]